MRAVKHFGHLQELLQTLIQGLNLVFVVPRHDSHSADKETQEGWKNRVLLQQDSANESSIQQSKSGSTVEHAIIWRSKLA